MNSKVINNIKWILFGRIVQALLAFVVSTLSARYLGPENFGIINYAASLVSFFSPIAYLGINSVLVQEIVEKKDSEGQVLGSAITISIFSSLLCIVGVVCFATVANPNDGLTVIVCALYSIMLVFQATEMIQYWFQAKYLSKYTALVMLFAYIGVSIYKIALLFFGIKVQWFAVSNAFDYALASLGLIFVYKKLGGEKFSFSMKTAKRIISKGKYYIVSGMMVTIFAHTDKIMLNSMLGSEAVGYYSISVTCAGITSFIFKAIIDSMRPLILEKKHENDETEYKYNLAMLYSVIIYLALLQSLFISVFSKMIVGFLYGKQYLPAIPALRIITWYSAFSYLGASRDIWILAEQKQKYLWIINLIGAISNVVLNLILIPIWGIEGAAVASLLTQIFTNVILGYIIFAIRENNRIIICSLNPKYIIKMLTYLLNKHK